MYELTELAKQLSSKTTVHEGTTELLKGLIFRLNNLHNMVELRIFSKELENEIITLSTSIVMNTNAAFPPPPGIERTNLDPGIYPNPTLPKEGLIDISTDQLVPPL